VRLVRRGRGAVLWPEGRKSAESFAPDGDGNLFKSIRGAHLVRSPVGASSVPVSGELDTCVFHARARIVLGDTWAISRVY